MTTMVFGDLEIGAFFQHEGSVYRKSSDREAVLLRDPKGNITAELTDFQPFDEVVRLVQWRSLF
ncbi:MAG: hypothetical protein AAGG48_29360 [Planctomycetota bacterium]